MPVLRFQGQPETFSDPVLDADEIGVDPATKELRVGNGSSPWSALPSAGSSTYARLVPGQYRVAGLGDSITAGDSSGYDPTNSRLRQVTIGDSPLTHALYASDGRWDLVTNAGVGGETSASILARVATDIVPANVHVCVLVSDHWNDIGTGVSAATAIANDVAIITALRASGIIPVICPLTPDQRTGSNGARILLAQQIREGVRSYCEAQQVPYIDLFSILVDTATGTLSTTYNRDGSVHPNVAGYKLMGQAIDTALRAIIPPRASGLIAYAADPTDLMAGAGLFLANTAGVGTGWTYTPASSGSAATITTDSAVLGSLQRLTGTTLVGNALIESASLTGWSVGDQLELSGYMTGSGGTAKPRIRLLLGGAPVPNIFNNAEPSAAITRGFFRLRQVIPAGTTSVKVRLQLQAGDGFCEWGQLSLKNRTTQGLTTN